MSHWNPVLTLAMLGAIVVGGCDRLQPIGQQDPRPPCSCLCEAADQEELQICVFAEFADAASRDCTSVCHLEAQNNSVWDSCENVTLQADAYPEMCQVQTVARIREPGGLSSRFEVDPTRSQLTVRQGDWLGTSVLTGDLGLTHAMCEGRSCDGRLSYASLDAAEFDMRRSPSRHVRIDQLHVLTDQRLGGIATWTSAEGHFVIRAPVLLVGGFEAAIINHGVKLGEGRVYGEYNMAGSVAYGTIDYETQTLALSALLSDGNTEIEVTITAVAVSLAPYVEIVETGLSDVSCDAGEWTQTYTFELDSPVESTLARYSWILERGQVAHHGRTFTHTFRFDAETDANVTLLVADDHGELGSRTTSVTLTPNGECPVVE